MLLGGVSYSDTTDLYIAYNKHLKDQLIRCGLDREKVKILPHAIDIEYYSPDKRDEHFWNKFGLDNLNNNILLFVGRLERHKGIVNLIKSFVSYIYPSYPNTTLVVISSGGTYEDYVTQVSKKHNVVIFLKMLPEEYMPVAYASADIGVFPSEREGFGMVYLESMASGTPTVGVNAGGPKEIISDGYNGILMPDNSEKSIYEAVSYLLENEKIRKKLSRRGRKTTERKFSPQVIAKKFIDICFELLHSQTDCG